MAALRQQPLLRPLLLLAMIASFIAYEWLWPGPHLRFQNALAGECFTIGVAVALPASLFWLGACASRKPLRVLLLCAGVLLAVPCAAVLVFSLSALPSAGDDDPAFTLISQLEDDGSTFRLYRSDCGATCSFDLMLRREADLPLGLKLSTSLWSRPREGEGALRKQGSVIQVVNVSGVLWSSGE